MLQKEKHNIKELLSKLMSAIGPTEIIRFLLHEISSTKDVISDETRQIDYVKDAQALRFSGHHMHTRTHTFSMTLLMACQKILHAL